MGSDQNLFISYAHIDNQPLTSEQKGWITRFHATLEAMLNMRMGGQVKIWRDNKLRGNDVFDDEIAAQFNHSTILVSVLTPRYLNSDWCNREIREFCANTRYSAGLLVDNKTRVFKVIKTPVDDQELLPLELQHILGYDFFTVDDGTPLELDPAFGEEYAQAYNRKIGKLAWDIAQLLKTLAADSSVNEGSCHEAVAPVKPTVYLAECSYDCRDVREVLEGELRRLGYPVLPDQRLATDEAEYVAEVAKLLARSELSIHLMGEHYGGMPDGPSMKSIGMHQNELAVQRCKSAALARVIWLPQGTRSDQAPQQAFIDALHQDAEAQFGADLITGGLEELKASIHATLEKLEKPRREPSGKQATAEGDAKLLYLICDERDRKSTVLVRKLCRQHGIEVALPAFEGDATQVREANKQLLASCDAVLIFYGIGDEAWKRTVDNELKKMLGYRGSKPLRTRYTYLAQPTTSDKEDFIDMEGPDTIDGLEGFAQGAMVEFIHAVNGAGATP